MAGQPIAPIIPNMNPQAEAVAGNQAAIFTATDRKILEEIAGEIDRSRSFIDVLKDRPLTPEVENEETTVKLNQDIKELNSRIREHRQILKHSTLYTPREHVEISNQLPDTYEEQEQTAPEISPDDEATINTNKDKEVHAKTVAMVKELNLNPAEIFDKFALEQEDLHNLVSQIKDLHLKRLLTENQKEFESISEEIKKETLAASKPEAKDWLTGQLNKLTREAIEYKLRLLKSLQDMDFNAERKKNIKWLKKIHVKFC